MKMLNENDVLSTQDMSLTATLCYFNYKIVGVDRREDSSKVYFLIEREKGLDETIQAFWSHTLKVEPLAYFNCLKEVKTRLYNT
ncbi:hypothetical protein HN615_14930 [Candidatus Woesearchaeota archaeon]|jgi:hypothetical protein|nr:hypothetical protein [Candidatus Woesearchaeota archaeon]